MIDKAEVCATKLDFQVARQQHVPAPHMDSAIVSRLFNRLATHHFCQPAAGLSLNRSIRCISYNQRSERPPATTYQHGEGVSSSQSNWQQRIDAFPAERGNEYRRYPLVTADELRHRKGRPKRVKMWMRDFIEDSLYNPNYGYFSKNVTIYSGEPFNFSEIKDEKEFHRMFQQRYIDFEDELDKKEYNELRQLWHTPTELFKPLYAEAIARYMVANYKLSLFPYHDLTIYELGAGNGTLMLNILDYIRAVDTEVYDRTRFRIIEVSERLADMQLVAAAKGHADKVEVINRSIFDWDTYVPTHCFFLAMEVFDNFAHDAIRYNPMTEQPLQGQVLIDQDGEFFEFYTPELDEVAERYLRVRGIASRDRDFANPLQRPLLRKLRQHLPMAPNLTAAEYIPTRLMDFFNILAKYFPAHRLVTSDFNWLPQASPGFNAPVVQTRYQRRTVLASTPLVHQGYFDILFPTDFGVMEDMYRGITGKLTRVSSHEDFFRRWSYLEETQMKSGENAFLNWYKNASVMITV